MGMFDDVIDNVGEPFGGGKGFTYGTHEVIIGEVEAITKKTKAHEAAEIIQVLVFDEADNDIQATCTLWFHSEGGAKMSVAKILGILVHNAGEDKKDTVRALGRKLFSTITDPVKARDVAFKLMQEKMVGKKAYLVAEPNGNYKTTKYGDLWHYAAEPQGTAPTEAASMGEDVTNNKDVVEDLPDFGDL